MWYRREESQKRFSFFFISTALAGAFGGLLASAIGKMDGHRGKLVRPALHQLFCFVCARVRVRLMAKTGLALDLYHCLSFPSVDFTYHWS